MLELIGEKGSSEYDAALYLAEAIKKLWPGVEKTPPDQDYIKIAANVKISGYKRTDFDVIACGLFHQGRSFIPVKVVHDNKAVRIGRRSIMVRNFIVAIEVKDHGENSVRISGDSVSVFYSSGASSGWSNATDQNIEQVHSLRHYLDDLGTDNMFVHRCLIMQGLGSINIGGALPAGYDGAGFFTSVAQVSKVFKSTNGYRLSSGLDKDASLVLGAGIFKKIVPTNLDRRRMDMILEGTHQSEVLYSALGKQMVRLRGHGGTGKTIMCLQAAWKLYEETGARSLVLTYNHALAADIRRLLALLNVPSDPELGGIKVDTVMSFMYSWFRRLQLLEDDEDLSFDNYGMHCKSATDMLKEGALTGDDVEAIQVEDPYRYDFNCIVVDEAQDWPQEEANLLKTLYDCKKICLADGIDQLIRGKATNWDEGVPGEMRKIIPLQKCLRMKRSLSVFVNKVAEAGRVNWNIEPNNSAGGGTIKILLRPYQEYEDLHQELVSSAKAMGNAELDFLFCVPPSSVNNLGSNRESDISVFLKGLGAEVWDGVNPVTRRNFPRGKNEFRIVQYESCRGLEGWTVVLNKPDAYWELCKNDRVKAGLSDAEKLALEDIEELARGSAWRKTLISLTRPLDTLVISLNDIESDFSSIVLDVARECSEFVEIFE